MQGRNMKSEESLNLLPRVLTKEEEKTCIELLSVEGKKEKAREVLIKHNMRLVGFIVSKKFSQTKIEYEDLFSVGCYGLIKGVDSFDPKKPVKLATYLSVCITNEILMELRRTNKGSKFTIVSMQDLAYSKDDGSGLTNEEMIADEENVEDLVVGKMENKHLLSKVNLYLEKAGEKKKKIIEKTFGINGEEKEKQEDIAKSVGCSQCNVSRVAKKTLKELKKELFK